MLAYRHAFHAGNHGDVLKHVVLLALLRHLNEKDKGWRYVDTHAGAGGYSLDSDYAHKRGEFEQGIGRLWGRDDLPPLVADYVQQVRAFNAADATGSGRGAVALRQYPGSPAFAHRLLRPQDQLRLFELHPTDHKILSSWLGTEPGVEVTLGDGFTALKGQLPPPTRRGLVLIDPPYELKTDYQRTLAALREALARFPQGMVMVWLPQLQLLEAAQLPQRLKAAVDTVAEAGKAPGKGWVHARLTVAKGAERGFGLLGSHVFVANPPHTLAPALQATLPWLAQVLAQDAGSHVLERSARA
jgi:23S rRNA (adenine2030-N6)-methyltransferase